jgi:serine/threonine-protein kinase HipA
VADHLDVWLDGRLAGTLERARGGAVTFAYAASYQALRAAPSLSVSIPRQTTSHGPDVTEPWIDNLLPDSDTVRARWAAQFGERRPTAFNLLRHMGADCAGAVQILPPGEEPANGAGRRALAEAEIAGHLRELRRDDASWAFARHGGRFSLGGQQGKFALARAADGTWHQPTGRGASTHIVKIGIGGLPRSDAAELVTMRVARMLGLTTAGVEALWFEDQPAVVVERFDRLAEPGGAVRRLHQEDLCQALGLWRSAKYESDGGPGIGELADLIARAADRRDLTAARETFARAVAFSWVSAGTDAHAKNYALLHVGSRTVLAPLYDLMSAALVLPPDEVWHSGRLAMRLGGEYRLRGIAARHLDRAAQRLGVDAGWFRAVAAEQAAGFADAVSDVVAAERRLIDAGTGRAFVDGAARRAADAARVLRSAGAEEPEQPEPDAVWVAAHRRAGRVVDGHWRTRPGR